jgi:hypothetical protein
MKHRRKARTVKNTRLKHKAATTISSDENQLKSHCIASLPDCDHHLKTPGL